MISMLSTLFSNPQRYLTLNYADLSYAGIHWEGTYRWCYSSTTCALPLGGLQHHLYSPIGRVQMVLFKHAPVLSHWEGARRWCCSSTTCIPPLGGLQHHLCSPIGRVQVVLFKHAPVMEMSSPLGSSPVWRDISCHRSSQLS